jgi:hypothetical protein
MKTCRNAQFTQFKDPPLQARFLLPHVTNRSHSFRPLLQVLVPHVQALSVVTGTCASRAGTVRCYRYLCLTLLQVLMPHVVTGTCASRARTVWIYRHFVSEVFRRTTQQQCEKNPKSSTTIQYLMTQICLCTRNEAMWKGGGQGVEV